jgi:general secretion pathway protein B
MSYILEALKKSDRERRQGEIPGLQSTHGVKPARGRRGGRGLLWAWLLSGTTLLIVAALALYWGMRKSNRDLQDKLVVLEKSVVQLKEQPREQPVQEVAPPAVSVAQNVGPQHSLMQQQGDSTARPPVSVGYEKTAARPVTPEEMAPLAMPAPGNLPPEEEKTVIRPESLPVKLQPEAVAVTPEGEKDVVGPPLMNDLPESVRKLLPPLKLAGHVYAKEATKRMIIINNRICREGDLVENHLVLEEILWEGVVLRFQDIRFRVKLL